MQYKTHNQDDLINANGTHLLSRVNIPYYHIEGILGAPMRFCGDKVQAEWNIKFEDGEVATIYDWKEYGRNPEDVTDWHIGGKNQAVVQRIFNILQGE